MANFKKLIINENSSILDAIKVIDSTIYRTCFVVNNQNKLIGSVTDGDIRRSLIKKINFKSKVSKICYKKTISSEKKNILNDEIKNSERCIPILNKKKQIIDIKIFKNEKNKIKSALIMAGGRGERLHPLTKNIPKPLLKIKGKSLLEILISKLYSSGINHIKISVHHMYKKIKNHMKVKKFNLKNSDYIIEKTPLGTGGSIKFFNSKENNFFVINCDIRLNVDFTKISNFHIQKKADITIVSKQIINKLHFGVLNINSQFFVKSIEEKPILFNYVSTGLYILNKKVKKLIKSNQRINMDEIITKAIKKKMKIVSYPLYENWADLGTKKVLKKFQK